MFKCKVCVVVLVGIPGAGKSTFCKELVNNFKHENIKVNIINYDDLCADNTSNSRKVVFNWVTSLIQENLNDNFYHAIVIDDNMFYKSMRKEYKSFCKTVHIGFFEIYFKVDLTLALSRNETRESNKIPKQIIINMQESLEVPTENVLIINSNIPYNGSVFTEFKKFLLSAFNNPMVLVENVKSEPSPLTEIQLIDLILRNIVHEKIAAQKQDAMKLNLIKQTLFTRIKKGNIVLNESNQTALQSILLPFFSI